MLSIQSHNPKQLFRASKGQVNTLLTRAGKAVSCIKFQSWVKSISVSAPLVKSHGINRMHIYRSMDFPVKVPVRCGAIPFFECEVPCTISIGVTILLDAYEGAITDPRITVAERIDRFHLTKPRQKDVEEYVAKHSHGIHPATLIFKNDGYYPDSRDIKCWGDQYYLTFKLKPVLLDTRSITQVFPMKELMREISRSGLTPPANLNFPPRERYLRLVTETILPFFAKFTPPRMTPISKEK